MSHDRADSCSLLRKQPAWIGFPVLAGSISRQPDQIFFLFLPFSGASHSLYTPSTLLPPIPCPEDSINLFDFLYTVGSNWNNSGALFRTKITSVQQYSGTRYSWSVDPCGYYLSFVLIRFAPESEQTSLRRFLLTARHFFR